MKNTQFLKKTNFLARLFLLLIFTIMICDRAAANRTTYAKHSFNDSIVVKVTFSRIAGKIKLYPNISNEALLFTASGEERKLYILFLFDMSGKLVSQAQLGDPATTLLSVSEKGSYMFEVFNNDDRLEYGSIVVK